MKKEWQPAILIMRGMKFKKEEFTLPITTVNRYPNQAIMENLLMIEINNPYDERRYSMEVIILRYKVTKMGVC